MATQRGHLRWDGEAATRKVRAAAVRGLRKGGEHILGEAVAIVPLDEGTLQDSGTVSVDEDALTATISFDTVYAVRQHEELTWRHAPGRQAKYLETPLNAERDTALAFVAAQIRRATR